MFFVIKNIIAKEKALNLATRVRNFNWQDGNLTAGDIASKVKNNQQLLPNNPEIKKISDDIISVLQTNQEFFTFALPKKIFPPSFNLYQQGQYYGSHIDNAVRIVNNSIGEAGYLRCDLSATLFLSDEKSYQGGELLINNNLDSVKIKLDAGDLIIYPANTIHQVLPITSGERLASFFWIESLIINNEDREMLFNLDLAIRQLKSESLKNHKIIENLLAIYHNLLRKNTIT